MGLFKKEKDSKQNKKLQEEKIKLMEEKLKKEEAELAALKDDGKVAEPEEVEETEESEEEDTESTNEQLTWIVENVATQTEPIIYNNKDKQTYTIQQALVKILNKLEL